MPLESASFITQLNANNPVGASDPVSAGDDHLRLIKTVLKTNFPNASKAFYFPTSLAEQAGDITVVSTDDRQTIPVNASGAARTVNLPATPADGFEVTIVKTDITANTVTIDPAGAVEINGGPTLTLTREFESIRCVYLSTFAVWIGMRSVAGSPQQADEVVGIAQGGTGQITAAAAFDALSTASADVASAATVNLDTNNSNYARITGTTTITAITLASGRKRWVTFSAALALTNGASLILPAAANIITAAGDTALFVGEAAGVVRCLWYARASGIALALNPAFIPARRYSEYGSSADLGVIPLDDTIPQITEGTETNSVTITLTRDNSIVRATFDAFGGATGTSALTAALFLNGASDAVQASSGGVSGNDRPYPLKLQWEHAPGTVGPHTYAVRCGPGTGGTGRLNGLFNGRRYGGASKATLVVEEVFVGG